MVYTLLVRLLHYADAHAGAIQALGSVASVFLTVVLVLVTIWYAYITRGTLALLRQERDDRIRVARAPVENALRQAEQRLAALEGLMARPATQGEIFGAQMYTGQVVNVVSQAGNAINSADVSDGMAMVARTIQDLYNALPRNPGAYGPALTDEQVRAQLAGADIPRYIALVREAILNARTRLANYVG